MAQCKAKVWDMTISWGRCVGCSKNAMVGADTCKIHSPEYLAAKKTKEQEQKSLVKLEDDALQVEAESIARTLGIPNRQAHDRNTFRPKRELIVSFDHLRELQAKKL